MLYGGRRDGRRGWVLVLVTAVLAAAAGAGGVALLLNIWERKTEARNPFFRVVEITDDRAVIEATLSARGKVTATCRGTFVAVKEGHPAYHRW